jgi:hypothetical protein
MTHTKDESGNELCFHCGARVAVRYGPDIRFTPPCTRPLMYRAECSADCLDPSWTSFTRERALEMWNAGTAQLRGA